MITGVVIFAVMIVCGIDWIEYEWNKRWWN